MPAIQPGATGSAEALNVRLVHFTKANSPEQPVQVAFSVIDDAGNEMIQTGECYQGQLYNLFQENNWLTKGAGGTLRTIAGRRPA